MEIIRRRTEEREKIIEEARNWVMKLGFKVTAILIGSYARGDFNKWSDIDIVLITDEIGGNPLEKLKKINNPPGYELIIWTLNEYRTLLEKKNPVALEIINNGVVLKDDYKIFER